MSKIKEKINKNSGFVEWKHKNSVERKIKSEETSFRLLKFPSWILYVYILHFQLIRANFIRSEYVLNNNNNNNPVGIESKIDIKKKNRVVLT